MVGAGAGEPLTLFRLLVFQLYVYVSGGPLNLGVEVDVAGERGLLVLAGVQDDAVVIIEGIELEVGEGTAAARPPVTVLEGSEDAFSGIVKDDPVEVGVGSSAGVNVPVEEPEGGFRCAGGWVARDDRSGEAGRRAGRGSAR